MTVSGFYFATGRWKKRRCQMVSGNLILRDTHRRTEPTKRGRKEENSVFNVNYCPAVLWVLDRRCLDLCGHPWPLSSVLQRHGHDAKINYEQTGRAIQCSGEVCVSSMQKADCFLHFFPDRYGTVSPVPVAPKLRTLTVSNAPWRPVFRVMPTYCAVGRRSVRVWGRQRVVVMYPDAVSECFGAHHSSGSCLCVSRSQTATHISVAHSPGEGADTTVHHFPSVVLPQTPLCRKPVAI